MMTALAVFEFGFWLYTKEAGNNHEKKQTRSGNRSGICIWIRGSGDKLCTGNVLTLVIAEFRAIRPVPPDSPLNTGIFPVTVKPHFIVGLFIFQHAMLLPLQGAVSEKARADQLPERRKIS